MIRIPLNKTLALGLLASALSSPLLWAQAPEMPPAAVEVAEAQSREIAPTIWVPGSVISRQDSRLSAELSGTLTWVAEVGDRVRQGQPIARLNDRIWALQVADDQADVARLQSNLTFLEKQVERNERLAQTNSASRSELERLTMEREMIRQQLKAAEIALERSQYDQSRAQLLAPFDGVVVERFTQPAEHISAGQAVLRLTNTQALEVSAQAPLDSARHLQPDTQVAISNQKQTQPAKVRSLVPVGDARSRMMELRITVDASHWLIGEAVRVELPNGLAESAMTVPRDALVLREHQVYVFKVGPDDKAVKVQVKTGHGYGNRISVEGDLTEGDRIVVRGAERLQEGQVVNILKQHAAYEGLASNS